MCEEDYLESQDSSEIRTNRILDPEQQALVDEMRRRIKLEALKKSRRRNIILRIIVAIFFVALIVVSIFTIKSGILHFSSRLANGGAAAVTIIVLVFWGFLIRSVIKLEKRFWIIILTQLLLYIRHQGVIFLIYWLVLLIKG